MPEEPNIKGLRSEAVEDFVKAIYILQQEYDLVPTTILAQRLNITPPSATDMAKKLSSKTRNDEPLVIHEKYRGVKLTENGRLLALEVLRHHRLIELYLVKALGYTWDEVHEEADRLEHVISERFEARIAEYLGHPQRDPHGDPIPTIEGQMPAQKDLISLDALAVNQKGVIARLLDQSAEKLQYLAGKGLMLGVFLEVTKREPFDGLTYVRVNDQIQVLSQSVTQSVLVMTKEPS